MALDGVEPIFVQGLMNQLDNTSTKSAASISDTESAKKASRLIQSIVNGETDENKLNAMWINQGWSKALS